MNHFVIYETATGRVLQAVTCSQEADIATHPLPAGYAVLSADKHHHPDAVQVEDGQISPRVAASAELEAAQATAELAMFRRLVRERYGATEHLGAPDVWGALSRDARASVSAYRQALRGCLAAGTAGTLPEIPEILSSKEPAA